MYISSRFELNPDDYKIIPYNWKPTRFHAITFEGWKDFSLDVNDSTLNNIMELASHTLHCFINLYKDKYAFSQPDFVFKPDGVFIVRIGTMENELYEYLKEKNESVTK